MNLQRTPKDWESREQKTRLAIVGIGCRFPGGIDRPLKYLQLLRDATCAISEAPDGRWNSDIFYSPNEDVPQKSVTKWAGFVPDYTRFDANLFGISPREAEAMDPQQRMLLEVTWEAFEDAGIAPDRLAGSNTGVYVGISMNDYQSIQNTILPDTDVSHMATGMALSVASNRISHKLDFHGPSLSVDTACSSSLVATDLASKALREGACDVAVVGGVNLLFAPSAFISFSAARMVSPTGRVLTFDSRADGFVRAEGAGVVLLKRLEDAQEAGDKIYAVLLSSGVNSDGHTSTLTVPNPEAQANLFREVCGSAGVAPENIDYVEAHGTGTPVGDPIEAYAIGSVFGCPGKRARRLLIGSVKSNIGHLEAGAGVAGLIKTALSLYHKETFANPNFETINPAIPVDQLNLEVSTETRAWPDGPEPRRAVVNSFGFGGTNACVLLEEAARVDAPQAAASSSAPVVVPLSAATETALKRLSADVAHHLGKNPAIKLNDAAATLALTRAALPEKLAIVASSRSELIDRLHSFSEASDQSFREGRMPSVFTGRSGDRPTIAFAFSGQGSQWHGMARQLIAKDAVFAKALADADSEIHAQSGWSVLEELAKPRAETRIDQTRITQACIFAVQTALTARWREWGIEPDMILGHSLGEIAAAHAAGALSLQDAVTVLHHRSSLQAEMEGTGAIYAVGLSAEAMQEHLIEAGEEQIELAAINSDQMVTIAGEKAAMAAFLKRLRDIVGSDLFRTRIRMNFAPHSPQMDPIRDRFLQGLAKLTPQATIHPLISTVTGNLVDGATLDADYWWRNIRRPVMFQNAMQSSIELGANLYLEIGPDAPLSGLIATCSSELGEQPTIIVSQKRGRQTDQQLKSALARLFIAGVRPDWSAIYPGTHQRLDIGRYPFERREYWMDGGIAMKMLNRDTPHPLLGWRRNAPEPVWEKALSLAEHPHLRDHKVNGAFIFPAAGYLEIMFAAYRELFGDGPIQLSEVEFTKANFLELERSELFQTRYDPGRRKISIFSRPADAEDEWDLRAFGTIDTPGSTPAYAAPLPIPPDIDYAMTGKQFYGKAIEFGYVYGKDFRGIKKVQIKGDVTWAHLAFKRSEARAPGYIIHPSVLDSVLQTSIAKVFDDYQEKVKVEDYIFLPRSLTRLRFEKKLPARFDVIVHKKNKDITQANLDKTIYDSEGNVALSIDNYVASAMSRSDAVEETSNSIARYYTDEMIPSRLSGADQPDSKGLWLVFRDKGGLGAKIAQDLRKIGQDCLIVSAGRPFQGFRNGRCSIDPLKPGEFSALLAAVKSLDDQLTGSIFTWPCDFAQTADSMTADSLDETSRMAVFPALDLVQGLIEQQLASTLVMVTKGAKVMPQDGPQTPRSGIGLAPVIGLARTVYSECPAIRVAAIDLDPMEMSPVRQARQIVQEAVSKETERETEVAYRGGRRFVPRFVARDQSGLSPRLVPGLSNRQRYGFSLHINQPGDLDNLRVVEAEEASPRAGEVAIGVRAVGLNFRDVMAATGLLPVEAEIDAAWRKLGMECSGIVEAVGEGVRDLKPGDRVITTSRGCFRSRIIQSAEHAKKVPDNMGYSEAATLLIAFSTAYFGLVMQARLRRGERVLIHLGTGGVGLAAIQVARMVGAEIWATAGSQRKRDFLRSLGIEHVMDSRSIDFVDQIRQSTDGRGVDVVLNALSGEALQRGLEVLAPCGRFIEIGKRDIYADSAIGMKVLRSNISLIAVDMARLGNDSPEAFRTVFTEVGHLIQQGKLQPLPTETYPLDQAEQAFTRMAKGEHIGKIVVTIDPETVNVALSDQSDLALDPDGAYLVTGGLGGFGLEVAVRLAERGAGRIYLMSRSGASTKHAKAGLRRIRKAGATPVVVKGDVTSETDVSAIFDRIKKDGAPLRGVLHAAVAYDDALIPQLDHQRMETVFRPKILGALNLHKATVDLDLDLFVLFSSVSVPFGNVGQANYVAANMFMESLARMRRANGLPGLCIAWGVMDIGEVQRNPELKKLFQTTGVPPMSVETALSGLEVMLRKSDPSIAFAGIDWQKYASANSHIYAQPRIVGQSSVSRSTGDRQAYHETMAAPKASRPAIVSRYMTEAIAKVLKVEPERIQPDTSLQDLGLDSLTAFQLKNRAEAEYGMNLQVSGFLQKPTVRKLSEMVIDGLDRERLDLSDNPDRTASGVTQPSLRQADMLASIRRSSDNACYLRSFENAGATLVSPPVQLTLLREAVSRFVEQHPVVASRFPVKRGRHAVAKTDVETMIVVEDCRTMDEQTFNAHLEEIVMQPLDISRGPLFQIRIFHRSDTVDAVLYRSHNAVLDGLSFLFAAEFSGSIFSRISTDRLESMRSSLSYHDFADRQRTFISSPKGRTQLLYWQRKLRGMGPPLALPFDHARTAELPQSSANHTFLLPTPIADHIKWVSNSQGHSLFTVLMAVFARLLHPFARGRNLPITTTATARTRKEIEGTIGAVSNTIIICIEEASQTDDLSCLEQLNADLGEALANQDYPAGTLIRDLELNTAPETSLDQVSFSQFLPERTDELGNIGLLANLPGARTELGGAWAESIVLPSRGARRDLSVLVQDHEGQITLRFEYDAGLFDANTIRSLADRYIAIAKDFTASSAKVQPLPLVVK